MSEKDGGPAFPVEEYDLQQGPHCGSPYDNGPVGVKSKTRHPGMTLRDYFAAQAMGHMLAAEIRKDAWANVVAVAHDSYKMADAMLAARSK